MSDNIKVSLFASAVRPKLWKSLFESLEGTSVPYEVIFAGNGIEEKEIYHFEIKDIPDNNRFEYIKTKNIKPAQCYEIGRRHCQGETVIWIADDCEFPNNVIGQAYDYWKFHNEEKLILSIQTRETGYNCAQGQLFDMNMHRFFGGCPDEPYNPLMAPIGIMSRNFLEELGGLDCRYVCGQYENDIVMRAYQNGARVEIFGGKDCFVDIDHLGKSILIGESKNEKDFLERPFASGYAKDREVLERSWTSFNQEKMVNLIKQGATHVYQNQVREISKTQLDRFEPYQDKDILTKSQSNRGKWE